MRTRGGLTGWLLVVSVAGITDIAQGRSAADKALPNPYKTIEQHAKMPPGRTLGSSSSVDIDPDGVSVWIADRCGAGSCLGSPLAPVFKLDAAGNTVKNFGAGMFVYPHGIHVDRDGNVWVVDGQSNLTPRGRGGRGARGAPADGCTGARADTCASADDADGHAGDQVQPGRQRVAQARHRRRRGHRCDAFQSAVRCGDGAQRRHLCGRRPRWRRQQRADREIQEGRQRS